MNPTNLPLVRSVPARRAGFTLFELLVVVAVIGVLVAMLMPVIGMARDTAQGVVCKSNLRQLSLAYLAYVEDNKGFLPNALIGTNKDHLDPALFSDYLDNKTKAWYCPVPYFRKSNTTFSANWWMNSYDSGASSAWSPGEQLFGKGTRAIRMAKAVAPGQAWVAADLDGANFGGYHRGYANMCFLDGRVRSRIDRSRTMGLVAWAHQDPSDSLKAEYIWPGAATIPGTRASVKGFNYRSTAGSKSDD